MQEINQIMSVVSTNMIIALLVIGLPWIRVAEVENGLTVVEDSVFRIYLENYPNTPVVHGVMGNLWTLVDAPKNGNLISLSFYFLNLALTLLNLRSASPLSHRLLNTIYHTSTLILLFSPSPPAFVIPLPLISLSLLNFSHLTPSLTLLHLLLTLPTISCLQLVAPRMACMLLVLAWQYLAMNFQQTVQYLVERKSAGVVAQDEEGQQRKKRGVINEYFRVQGYTQLAKGQVRTDEGPVNRVMWALHLIASAVVLGVAISPDSL